MASLEDYVDLVKVKKRDWFPLFGLHDYVERVGAIRSLAKKDLSGSDFEKLIKINEDHYKKLFACQTVTWGILACSMMYEPSRQLYAWITE